MIATARITLPRRQSGLLERGHLEAALRHPVVVLAAGAGYGKSQLIAELGQRGGELAYGLCSRLGENASSLLELLFAALGLGDRYAVDRPWQPQADELLESLFERGQGWLVLDDLHHLEGSLSDAAECRLLLSYLLDYRPEGWRVLLSGRSLPGLADLELRCLRGEAVVLGGGDLALTEPQLERLAPGWGGRLMELTSGWPLAAALLVRTPPEQWEAQRDSLGESLLRMATSELSAEARRALGLLGLMGWASQKEIGEGPEWAELTRLAQEAVLVHAIDRERVQLHPLFAEQYQREADLPLRERAARGLLAAGRTWEALELFDDPETVREQLLQHGDSLLQAGRHHLLSDLLGRAAEHPTLTRWMGEVQWRLGDPGQAILLFHRAAQQAGERGQRLLESESWLAAARLYLDAVCPDEARLYLRRAYRALGPGEAREKARLLERFAENAVNQGRGRHAARYRRLAALWDGERQDDLVVSARILLRSGRLSEARGGLQAALERGLSSPQSEGVLDGHRDPRLVLAYVLALEGRYAPAGELAEQVLEQAQRLGDRLTEAVALARLGHARLLQARAEGRAEDEVLSLYARADALIRSLGVQRLRAEMLMGQAVYHTWRGNTPRAYEAAREGVELSAQSGDAWMQAWLELVSAAAALEGSHPAALDLLRSCREAFRRCRDRFGYAVAELWLTKGGAEDVGRRRKALEEFPFLAQRVTLMGPDPSSWPAGRSPESSSAEGRWQVFCLGPLSIVAAGQPLSAKAFKRKKARELFALLLAAPDTYFHREELAAQLWPEADHKAALRDFRVALHALSDALEPNRPKNTTASCLDRQEERYRLLSSALEMDTVRFEELAKAPDTVSWERALKLYRGPFCEDYPYLESLEPVRQKFDRISLELGQRLAETYLTTGRPGEALELAQRMLARDATWEPAYRLLMRGQAALGHHHLLPRTFTLCLETLEEELGVEPGEETFALARELLGDQLATLL